MDGATLREHWEEEGYVVVEEAYSGEDLKRLQTAFDHHAEAAKEDWLEEVASCDRPGAFFDIPRPLEQDDAFVDLADHPGYFSVLVEILGSDLLFRGAQVRTLPVSPISYVGWHPDKPHSLPQHSKVQIYVNDVPENRGAFAYVPGSHKAEVGPCPAVDQLEDMPGYRVFSGKAGTAVIFNTRGWHTSMLNRTKTPRKSIIVGHSVWFEEGPDPERYAFLSDQLITPERRKLFGVEPWHD